MKFWALSYSIPANPSRYRVAVWKALKELGAVYLQPAVAIAPMREGMKEELLAIRDRVLASAGTAALLTLEYDGEADETAMIETIRSSRTEEYDEITADARRLLAQLEWEEGQGRALETERYALECRRLRRRLTVATGHDFFDAPGRGEARSAIDAVAARLPEMAETTARPTREKRGKTPPVGRPSGKKTAKPRPAAPQAPVSAPVPPVEEDEREDMPVFLF